MKDYGLVSVIMPTYNSAEYVIDTLKSILTQTYPNWELLITDDCSSDHTCEVISRYTSDKRIKLFHLKQNGGAGVARNNSIANAKGRFIAFCDSDDSWLPEKLEKQLAFMEEKDCALSYTSYMLCDEKNKTEGVVICRKKETFSKARFGNEIGCLTAMYDTRKVGKVYMPDLRKRQDWGLWLKILQKCKVAYGMKEPLARYRVRSGSISSNKASLVKYNLNVYKKVLGYSSLKAYCLFYLFFLPSYFQKKLFLKYLNR